ncbi:MAG: SAM-dependent methyltransferase [Opitutaceae bacterium]
MIAPIPPPARDRFLDLLRAAVGAGTLVNLTLGKHRGADATLKNVFVRPVALKAGPHLAFVWRHATRDITKNLPPAEALAQLDALVGRDFLDAHLFTTTQTAQYEANPTGTDRLRVLRSAAPSALPNPPVTPLAHDRAKNHLIPTDAPWLRALGVVNDRGQPREGMADKFRQIQKFAELLSHLLAEAALPSDRPATVVDMGSGKGYLTFAVAHLLGDKARVHGIEARPELVDLCNRVARDNNFSQLTFTAGQIAAAPIETRESKSEVPPDVLIALHACDTATDDALARGIGAGARLLVVSPCCQKELRPQLTAPPVLASALRHGIFQERQAEFVTDALRAQLLEWAGYRTKVFEFISTEHTAKNLMIAALKTHPTGDPDRAAAIREFAAFYGIRRQRLAENLSFEL